MWWALAEDASRNQEAEKKAVDASDCDGVQGTGPAGPLRLTLMLLKHNKDKALAVGLEHPSLTPRSHRMPFLCLRGNPLAVGHPVPLTDAHHRGRKKLPQREPWGDLSHLEQAEDSQESLLYKLAMIPTLSPGKRCQPPEDALTPQNSGLLGLLS